MFYKGECENCHQEIEEDIPDRYLLIHRRFLRTVCVECGWFVNLERKK